MPRRKSNVQKGIESRKPLEQVVVETNETIEEAEKRLRDKLVTKYQARDEESRQPGKVIDGKKIPWTMKDMEARFPMVNFVPDETVPLTWNGVKVYAIAGIEIHAPKPFYDIWNHRKAELMKSPNFPGIQVEAGAGALPPE